LIEIIELVPTKFGEGNQACYSGTSLNERLPILNNEHFFDPFGKENLYILNTRAIKDIRVYETREQKRTQEN
jgi:hypothetical protein